MQILISTINQQMHLYNFHYVAYDAHLANYTLYNRFLQNMIFYQNTLFTKTK